MLLSLPVVSNEYGATFLLFFIGIYQTNGQNMLIESKDQWACQHYLNVNLFVQFVFCLLSIDKTGKSVDPIPDYSLFALTLTFMM